MLQPARIDKSINIESVTEKPSVLTLSSSNETSGAMRMKSLFQNSYLGFLSNSMKVVRAPQGCGLWTMNRSSRTFVITSRNLSSLTSMNRCKTRALNQWVWALGYRRWSTMALRRWCCPRETSFRFHEGRGKNEEEPSTSILVARYWMATTPGSVGMNTEVPLLALACATEETPIYITTVFRRERLYESGIVSVIPGYRNLSFSVTRKEGDPRLRRNWSRWVRRSVFFRAEVKSERMGGIGPISGIDSREILRRWGSGKTIVGGKALSMMFRSWMQRGGMTSQRVK